MRARLADRLGYYGEDAGAEALERLIEDSNAEVAKEAKKALRLLGRLPVPEPSAPPTYPSGWRKLLSEISRRRLADPDTRVNVPDEKVVACWLGEPGATEDEIEAAERRISMRLPPSYREFLSESNGFDELSNSIYRLFGSREVDWFCVRNQFWIDAWQVEDDISPEEHLAQGRAGTGDIRRAYMKSCLQISDVGDSAVMLLNPEVVNEDGEWEAWFLANWLPGAATYESFRDLMEHELIDLMEESSPL